MLYIHITVEEERSRIEHATVARGSCEATAGRARGAGGGGAGRGGV